MTHRLFPLLHILRFFLERFRFAERKLDLFHTIAILLFGFIALNPTGVRAANFVKTHNCASPPSGSAALTTVVPGDTLTITFLNCARIYPPSATDAQGRYILASSVPRVLVPNGTIVLGPPGPLGSQTGSGTSRTLNYVAGADLPEGSTVHTIAQVQYNDSDSNIGLGATQSYNTPPNNVPTLSGPT